MSSSGSGKQTRVQRLKPSAENQQLDKIAESQVELSSDIDLTGDLARQLQPQLGNEALQRLMGSEQASELDDLSQAEEQEEEQAVDLDVDQEEGAELDQKLEIPSFGGGPGAPADPSSNPWNVDLLFGGDDDEGDNIPKPRKRPRTRKRRGLRRQEDLVQDAQRDDQEAPLREDVAEVQRYLPTPDAGPTTEREGDSRYRFIEISLESPGDLARTDWQPEDLVDAAAGYDPLALGSEIGHFLGQRAESLRTRSISRLIHRGLSSLLPSPPGYASGVARVANLCVCAQAYEGGGERTDRAVALSQDWSAWPDTVNSARALAQEGRLHAPKIFAHVLGGERDLDGETGPAPGPSPLGAAALQHILPEGFLPHIPDLHLPRPVLPPEDPQLAQLDAVLAQLSTGEEAPQPDPDPVLTGPVIQPLLYAARHLLNAIGRAQVECAAAATAVVRRQANAEVEPILVKVDGVLKKLARRTVVCGNQLGALVGSPVSEVEAQTTEARDALREASMALTSLRQWTFRSLSGWLEQ